ncbi:sugar phosphate isomerase/epimerase family protein [Gaoshiqia sp. Z1-71]|uniref:sugar phosphate isomerase/epimerase family protein n=1 Tax=Gaoshiqia hydrogeniformans TaxID=3290090 RepID=UPI003BF773FF
MKNVKISSRAILFILAVFVLSATFVGCNAPAPKETKKEIGIQLWSVREAMKTDAAATIARLSEIGYTYVEAAGYGDGLFYGMKPTEFRALLEENGMSMRGSHTGINLPKEGEWEQAMEWWDACIAAHQAAGAEWIVKPSMGGDSYRSLDTLQMYCDYYNVIGEKCNAAGIRFGYHNHAQEFTTEFDGVIFYDYLLQNTDPEKVMFELDLYWIKEGGKDALDYFNNYPGRFELYHVKDVEELGASGTIDFKPAFDAAELAGMKAYIVEVERYNFEPIVSVEKSFEFLNQAEYTK